MVKKLMAINGRAAKPNELIKMMLSGVYFVTPNDPKNVDPDLPFRVRVGKATGKDGIYSRIATHQGSNFDRLYFTVLTPLNCPQAYEEHDTPIKLEKYIHKIFKEEHKTLYRDSWYEFKNLHHFLTTVERQWCSTQFVMQEDCEELGNLSELMDEYKYTETQVSFNLFYDMDERGVRRRMPSSFEWFCTTPVQKGLARPLPDDLKFLKPKVIRGIVFKKGLVYEEYFNDWKIGNLKQYQKIVGGYIYMKPTEQLIDSQDEWEDIVIIGKEQNEITQDTPFMELARSKHYFNQSTPAGDTLIVLGSTFIHDHGHIECSLKRTLTDYNYFMNFPCYHMTFNNGDNTLKRNFQYRPYDANLTEEGAAHHTYMKTYFDEMKNSS